MKSKEKELELNVSICIEEDLPDDPEVLVHFQYSNLKGLVLIIEGVVFVQTKNGGSGSKPNSGCVCLIACALSMLSSRGNVSIWSCWFLKWLSLVRLDEQMPGP